MLELWNARAMLGREGQATVLSDLHTLSKHKQIELKGALTDTEAIRTLEALRKHAVAKLNELNSDDGLDRRVKRPTRHRATYLDLGGARYSKSQLASLLNDVSTSYRGNIPQRPRDKRDKIDEARL